MARTITPGTRTGTALETVGTLPGSTSPTSNVIQQQAAQIAQQLLAQQLATFNGANGISVFSRFDVNNDIVANMKQTVTTGIWSNGVAQLRKFYTGSSMTVEQKKYYYEIYQSQSSSPTAEPQFSVAWGHRKGSGSATEGQVDDGPSRAIYSQYRLLLLEPSDYQFTFEGGIGSDNCYFINFNRARIKEKLDPGNWELYLAKLNGASYPNRYYTGSNVQVASPASAISLIDDSNDTDESKAISGTTKRVYNVVSGTIEYGIYKKNNKPQYYGLVYPDLGIIVLNGDVLNKSASFNTVSGSDIAGDNAYKLFKSISGSSAYVGSFDDEWGFSARSSETVTSTHYFCRVKNAQFNFSNNPTFVTGSDGSFRQPTFTNDPKVYITTVGLYNDRQELLAVAKLSKPILKSFTNEVIIKVKLDF